MAETLSTTLTLNLASTLANPVDEGTAQFALALTNFLNISLASGNSADQANQLYVDRFSIAGSGNAVIDMHAFGSVADALGQSRAVTKLKVLAIQCRGSLDNYYVSGVAIAAAGTGYSIDDILVCAGGTGTAAKFHVTSVGGGGAITGISLEPYAGFTGGSYTTAPSTPNSATGGGGSGASLTLTLVQYGTSNAVFVDSDTFTIGGDGATSALTSLLGTNADKYIIPAGSRNCPGMLLLTSGSGGWTVGASTTNKNVKIVNSGSNPMTFTVIAIGAT